MHEKADPKKCHAYVRPPEAEDTSRWGLPRPVKRARAHTSPGSPPCGHERTLEALLSHAGSHPAKTHSAPGRKSSVLQAPKQIALICRW